QCHWATLASAPSKRSEPKPPRSRSASTFRANSACKYDPITSAWHYSATGARAGWNSETGAGRPRRRNRPERGLKSKSPLRAIWMQAGKIVDVLTLLILANGSPLVAKQLLADRRCYPWTGGKGMPFDATPVSERPRRLLALDPSLLASGAMSQGPEAAGLRP